MKKEVYVNPEMDVILLDVEDVIKTSGNEEGDMNLGDM